MGRWATIAGLSAASIVSVVVVLWLLWLLGGWFVGRFLDIGDTIDSLYRLGADTPNIQTVAQGEQDLFQRPNVIITLKAGLSDEEAEEVLAAIADWVEGEGASLPRVDVAVTGADRGYFRVVRDGRTAAGT